MRPMSASAHGSSAIVVTSKLAMPVPTAAAKRAISKGLNCFDDGLIGETPALQTTLMHRVSRCLLPFEAVGRWLTRSAWWGWATDIRCGVGVRELPEYTPPT